MADYLQDPEDEEIPEHELIPLTKIPKRKTNLNPCGCT